MPANTPPKGVSLSETFEDSASQHFIPAVLWKAVGVLGPCGPNAPEHRIIAGETTIGRQGDVTIQLPFFNVSRRHARIVVRNGDFILEDLESANGTFVDGVPVRSCILRDGDLLQIGTCRMSFHRILEVEGEGSTE